MKIVGNKLGIWDVAKLGIYEGSALGYSDDLQQKCPL